MTATPSDGFILYHRNLKTHHIRSKPVLFSYWMHCLESAAWKDHKVWWNNEEHLLERGSFISSASRDSDALGLSRQQIRTAQKYLARCQMITISPTNGGTLINVCNYSTWQDWKQITNQGSNQQLTSDQPTPNQQLTSGQPQQKEGKERKEGKRRKRITTDAPEYSESFEKFWKIYPKHEDKAEAFELYQQLQPDHEKELLKFAFSYGSVHSRARARYAKKAKYILRNMEWQTWMSDQQQTKREADPEPVRDIKPPATGVRSYGAYALRVRDQCKGIDTAIIKAAFEEGIDVNQLIQNHQQEAV